MKITFQGSKGDTVHDCLIPGSSENEKFVDWLLATDLSFWQHDYCENRLTLVDESNAIRQHLDLYRHQKLGFLLRLSIRYPHRPTCILYAWNGSHPSDEVGAVHLPESGMVYPAQLFHPKDTVKDVLLDFSNFSQTEEHHLGSVPWIGTDCISGEITEEPEFENFMSFTINYEELKKYVS